MSDNIALYSPASFSLVSQGGKITAQEAVTPNTADTDGAATLPGHLPHTFLQIHTHNYVCKSKKYR
ncbi:hypothetical protein E2C01_043128 [Portunus trituberculatus]|uniref:Uncharacterized protein n=1 Tax=Portunus trituberculatus TaxID=210409 RepID=A0A5B7FNM3_PORTR|nr:hypothetical protein [Portunus trituberculatus]